MGRGFENWIWRYRASSALAPRSLRNSHKQRFVMSIVGLASNADKVDVRLGISSRQSAYWNKALRSSLETLQT